MSPTRTGGHFGSLTLKQARLWIDACGQDGFQIEDNRTSRHTDESIDDCITRHRKHAYRVTDSYRPGFEWTGSTPRKALNAAGAYPSNFNVR